MALTTSTNKAQYKCNNSTTEFDLEVRILDENDVLVYLKDTTDGTQTLLEVTTNYTIEAISGDYDNGARITTVSTYSSDYEITLLREVDFDQELDLEEGGDLPSNSLEDALDKGVMQAQQLSEQLNRAVVAPATDPDGLDYGIGSVDDRASTYLGFDASGNVANLEITDPDTLGVNTSAGLSLTGSILSAKVDDDSIEFDENGNSSIKDDGVDTDKITDEAVTLAKMADMATDSVIGRVSALTGVPEVVSIVGLKDAAILIDDDTFEDNSNTTGATQQSIKAYVDTLFGTRYFTAEYISSSGTTIGTTLQIKKNHGLDSAPKFFQAVLKCNDEGGDIGYSQNDEVDAICSFYYTSGAIVWANATEVGYSRVSALSMPRKNTGAIAAIDETKWDIYFKAWN